MAIPVKYKDSFRGLLNFADDKTDLFEGQIYDVQQQVYRAITAVVKNLDTDADGNIKQTSRNLKHILAIRKLNRIIVNSTYRTSVMRFIEAFDFSRDKIDNLLKRLPNA